MKFNNQHMQQINKIIFIPWFLLIISCSQAQNIIIVIIDGARYSETLGDSTRTYTPRMWELAEQGTYLSHFYNDSLTYTSRAIPAIWCGTWTDVRDTLYNDSYTKYAVKPTIFEYILKQKNLSSNHFFYVIKFLPSLWLPSFDPDYGPDYWPTYHSIGKTDNDVAYEAEQVMKHFRPQYLLIYLADVDGAGHSGNWQDYIGAIQIADSLVGNIWERAQDISFYANKTTMFVTNDHGRHDDAHGGFSGHGDSCMGCRHIQLLAIGPNIKQNYISDTYRRIPDVTTTIGQMANVDMSKVSGSVMEEIFASTLDIDETEIQVHIDEIENYPNPFNAETIIRYNLSKKSNVILKIYDISGREIVTLINSVQNIGTNSVIWNGYNQVGNPVSSGIYFSIIQIENMIISHKLLMIK